MAAITAITVISYAGNSPHFALPRRPFTAALVNLRMISPCATTAENTGVFSITPSSKADFDYLGQSTKGDLNLNLEINDGEAGLDSPIEDVARMEAQEAE